jgi:adenylate kinase family enzyme
MSNRLAAADLAIYLDYPGWLCAWRVFKRWLLHRQASRPELPSEARERLSLPFILMTLRRGERPGIERTIASAGCRLVRLRSPHEAEAFLARQTR